MLKRVPLFALYFGLQTLCVVHISYILFFTLNPTLPSIEIYEQDLKKVEFPLAFRVCVDEKTYDKYTKIGYINDWEFFLGRSMYNKSMFGWNGHTENGTTIGSVKGILYFQTRRESMM